ncbi:MAG: hypothetical protein LKK19_05700 [Bacteroidales bacterium]|jgi:hypothetical protein|nr:hypothetical protein [Bacteroidales bacterium]MCI2122179.1 hypothetical protein [Bacteroidales bacterium]MCI2145168.1 hypothetical protein [Bacteroidales bacterium]
MKKILLFVSMLVLLCSCDPERYLQPPYVGIWYVRNDASQNLYILASTVTFKADSVLIKPGDSTFLVKADYPYEKDLKFDQIAHTNVTYPSAYVGFYRDPEFKSLIKGWHESEADNPTGHKFLFSESYWTEKSWFQDLNGKKDYYSYRSWTYTVTDDDLKAWEAGQ